MEIVLEDTVEMGENNYEAFGEQLGARVGCGTYCVSRLVNGDSFEPIHIIHRYRWEKQPLMLRKLVDYPTVVS